MTIPRAINHVFISDWLREYDVYLHNLSVGHWTYITDSIVNSSLVTTLLPMYFQQALQLSDQTLLFRIWPGVLFSGVPVMAYFIARLYFTRTYAVTASLFVMTHFYFMVLPFLGRVQAGWLFFSILVYAVLTSRLVLAVSSVVLLVFAHYGSAIFAVGLLGTTLIYNIWMNREWRLIAISLTVLLAVGYIWYYLIAYEPGRYISGITKGFLEGNEIYMSQQGIVFYIRKWLGTAMAIDKKLLWVAMWLTFLIMGVGVSWYTIHKREIGFMMLILWGVVIAPLIIPGFDVVYGIARFYFTGLPLTAVALVKGLQLICRGDTAFTMGVVPLLFFHPSLSPF